MTRAMTPRLRSLVAGLVLAMAATTVNATTQPQRRGPRGALVMIPAGTVLNVRLTQTIDVDYAQPGSVYHAVLSDPVMMGRTVVIPYGARVTLQALDVRQSGRFKGSDRITLSATSVSFSGRTYAVATSAVQTKSKGQGKKTAKHAGIGAGIGAAMGGLFGGGSGAAIGAVVGGTTGVVTGSHGEHLIIPAETWMQFQLNTSLTVRR
jgi:YmgG-like glycine-zipper protein